MFLCSITVKASFRLITPALKIPSNTSPANKGDCAFSLKKTTAESNVKI